MYQPALYDARIRAAGAAAESESRDFGISSMELVLEDDGSPVYVMIVSQVCRAIDPPTFTEKSSDDGCRWRHPGIYRCHNGAVEGFCCCCILHINRSGLNHTRYPVIYVVANPVRGHKEVPRSTGRILVTTRYSNQVGSKSRQKVMRLFKQWHRPISKRFIKPPLLHIESSLDRLGLLSPIDSDCCRLPTTSVLSNKSDKYVPTSFDQQFQVSQGHTSYKNKEN